MPRPTTEQSLILKLATAGAIERIQAIRREEAMLLSAFPTLKRELKRQTLAGNAAKARAAKHKKSAAKAAQTPAEPLPETPAEPSGPANAKRRRLGSLKR